VAGADPEGTSWGRTEGPSPGFTSFYHVAVKHNARPVYVWILWALGACIYRRDSRGRLACDIITADNASSQLIRQLLGNFTVYVSTDSIIYAAILQLFSEFCVHQFSIIYLR